jgi:putative transposase
MRTDLVLDALEHALHQRGMDETTGLVHHSDRGVQLGFKVPSQRLGQCRGRIGDWAVQDGGISRRDRWRTLETVEFATLRWVDWINHRRLLGSIGFVPPPEHKAHYYQQVSVA